MYNGNRIYKNLLINYVLAVLRLNGQECKLSDFLEQEYKPSEEAIREFPEESVLTFNFHKLFDSAIQLETALGSHVRQPLDSKIS